MNSLDLAWAAGLIDADGAIQIRKIKPAKCSISPSFQLTIQVKMTHEITVRRLYFLFGVGSIQFVKSRNPKWRDMWSWQVVDRQATSVVTAILPYLVTKRRQAIVGLMLRRTYVTLRGGPNPLSKDVLYRRERCHKTISKLNKRGT